MFNSLGFSRRRMSGGMGLMPPVPPAIADAARVAALVEAARVAA